MGTLKPLPGWRAASIRGFVVGGEQAVGVAVGGFHAVGAAGAPSSRRAVHRRWHAELPHFAAQRGERRHGPLAALIQAFQARAGRLRQSRAAGPAHGRPAALGLRQGGAAGLYRRAAPWAPGRWPASPQGRRGWRGRVEQATSVPTISAVTTRRRSVNFMGLILFEAAAGAGGADCHCVVDDVLGRKGGELDLPAQRTEPRSPDDRKPPTPGG